MFLIQILYFYCIFSNNCNINVYSDLFVLLFWLYLYNKNYFFLLVLNCIWVVLLINMVVQMRMLRQWSARLEEHLYSSRTSGSPKCCHYTQRYACLTPMWSLYYCMEQRHGGQLTPPSRNYRPLLITVWEESSKFAGQTPSITATCGRKHTNRMLEMRSGDDGGGLITHSGNQHQQSTGRP